MEIGALDELRTWRNARQGSVALVPTMGALHSGHRALMDKARESADFVVVSLFVNPLQFGAGEDYAHYPRPFDDDIALCESAGVDFVFAPTEAQMYPSMPEVRVSAGRMGAVFEGASRPGHFDGVLTVVAKLFSLVDPNVAVFGLKDIQQFCLVRRMIGDLNFTIDLIGLPVVRDADGLAMSSRNVYLSNEERRAALAIPEALKAATDRKADLWDPSSPGQRGAANLPAAIEQAARDVLDRAVAAGDLELDYLTLVDAETLLPCREGHRGSALLLVSANVGRTRLIDNVPMEF